MRIGLIAEKTGVSRDTIRLYESMGLLTGITRPYKYNNYKEYAEENIERVKMIITMKGLGLSLKECKEVITTIEEQGFDKSFQDEFIANKLNEIDTKIQQLQQLKETLLGFVNKGCDNPEVVDKIKVLKKEDL